MTGHLILVNEEKLDRDEIVKFLSGIFRTNSTDPRIVKEIMFDAEPSISTDNFIFARSTDNNLIGLVRIVERNIIIESASIHAGCISSVSVKPDWRGKGIARELMNKALEAATAKGMDISVVYGRRAVDGFYPRFGYYGVGRYVDLKIISDTGSDSSIQISAFKKEHLDACILLYDKTYGGLSGSVMRNRPIWNYLLSRLERNIGGFKVFVCLEKKKAVGYFIILDTRLIEIAVPDKSFSAIPALLRKLNVESISIHPRHPFHTFCRTHMNTVLHERFAIDGGYMARILNPGSLLGKLGPVLAARAAVLGISDKYINLLNYKIDLSNGNVSGSSRASDVDFTLPETAVQLLLGVIRPEDIVGVKWSEEKQWISYLFPELHYHTSAWDEV